MPNPRQNSASAPRPRVAGLRKRATQGRPEQSAPAQPSTEESAADAVVTTPARTEPEVVVDQGVVDVEPTLDEPVAELPGESEPEPEPEPEPESEPEPEPEPATAEEPEGGSSRKLVTWLLAATAVFAVLAVVFGFLQYSARTDGPAANEALVNAPATAEVTGQVNDAVAKIFSYDFADTAKTERAAQDLLVGQAVDEYNRLFATVKQLAPQQKLVVTTTVKSSGVTRLQGDRAEVLLFVDQQAVRTDSGQTNVGPAQISIGAEKQGDRWKISNIVQR